MSFAEKLQILMASGNVASNKLARVLNIDPSLLSRWKNGYRKPSRESGYMEKLAAYFASNANTEERRAEISKLCYCSLSKEDKNCNLEEAILKWLTDDTQGNYGFQMSFASENSEILAPPSIDMSYGNATEIIDAQVFLGFDGRRRAILALLSKVMASGAPCDILFFSDETVDWLTSDRYFYEQLVNCAKWFASIGGKIIVDHMRKSNLEEMVASLNAIFPFYLTGCTSWYYDPLHKQNAFQNFGIHALGTASVISRYSLHNVKMTNTFFTDPTIVRANAAAYYSSIDTKTALLNDYTTDHLFAYLSFLTELFDEEGPIFFRGDLPAFLTLNLLDFERLSGACGMNMAHAVSARNVFRKCLNTFQSFIQNNECIMMVSLPKIDDVLAGREYVCNSEFLFDEVVPLDPAVYVQQLKNALLLLQRHEHLHMHILEQPVSKVSVCAKFGKSFIVANSTIEPSNIFGSQNRDVTDAMWNILDSQYEAIPLLERSKAYVIKRLNRMIQAIEPANT